jgi:hypothetical protein
MRLLIDTQIFIWAVLDSPKLGSEARRVMLDANEVIVSAASIWEIAIKAKNGTNGQRNFLRLGLPSLPCETGFFASVSPGSSGRGSGGAR